MKIKRFLLLSLACFASVSPTALPRELDTLKDTTEKWIQLRNRLSKERAVWDTEKELLKDSVSALQSNEEILVDHVRVLELQASDHGLKIEEAKTQIDTLQKTDALILKKVESFETRIKEMARRLPEPLKDKVRALLLKIPEPGSTAPPIPNRLQNVVALSTLIDEFNNNITLTHTLKPLPDGSLVEVRVLYWGLASAYASNADGSETWVLTPAIDQWNWQRNTEGADEIKRLFEVYDKTIDPRFAAVPFAFQNAGGSE